MAATILPLVRRPGGTLVDVGCGAGQLWPALQSQFDTYVGCDVVKYDNYPGDREFLKIDLDTGKIPLPDGTADVAAALETIEHLENPRAFVRELTRLVKPGGWVLITTPNNLSLLSKLTLVLKNQFNAFQDSCYPAHITALVETDLMRIAGECGLTDLQTAFSRQGRIPGTSGHYPRWASRLFPRSFSDNVLILGRKPDCAALLPGLSRTTHQPICGPTAKARDDDLALPIDITRSRTLSEEDFQRATSDK